MRIVSKFKDFYDFASPYRDSDVRSFYWERHTRQESVELKTLQKDFSVDNRIPYHGQNYAGLPEFRVINGYRGKGSYEEEFVVVANEIVSIWKDVDALIDHRPAYSTLPAFKHKKWNSWRFGGSINTYPVVMKNTFAKFKEFQETYKTPILHICVFGSYLQIRTNPRLMDYGVQHKLTP
jgi:hypothetical protein